jgi:hypothetical protein
LPPVIPFIDTAATRAMASFGVTFAPITGPNATGATSGPVASAGGKSKTANFSSWSGEDEHRVIKSLVFCDEQENPFIVLMHGDYYVQNRSVALAVGVRRAGPCAPEVAEKHTGMQTGGQPCARVCVCVCVCACVFVCVYLCKRAPTSFMARRDLPLWRCAPHARLYGADLNGAGLRVHKRCVYSPLSTLPF